MYKLLILSIFLIPALDATSQAKAFAMASAAIVTPVGTNLVSDNENFAENMLPHILSLNTNRGIQRLSNLNKSTAMYSSSIHIASLQIVGSNYTMYSIILPLEMKLSNQTSKSSLQFCCYSIKQERAERNDEMVMINATVAIPSNQALGNYVADDQLNIMINYN